MLDSLCPETVAPVYLLHGPERFFIDQVIARLKALVLSGPMADFNFQSLKAETTSGGEIVGRAREIPMMAAKRLVVIENGHKLTVKDLEALGPYWEQPAPETCMVIVADKLDLRKGAFAKANKRGLVYKAEPIKEKQIIPFLRARSKARGVKMEPGALRAVATAVGSDCGALDDALERLCLYSGGSATVTEEDVSQVVTAVREHSVFELVDAIGSRQPSSAIALLESLLSSREEPIKINAMVARHIRLLLNTRIHIHMGTDQRSLAGLLGVPPFVVSKLITQTRSFRGSHLEQLLARLAMADFELKSSRRPPKLVIVNAVLDLCLGV